MKSNWHLGRRGCLARIALVLLLVIAAWTAIYMLARYNAAEVRNEGDHVVQWIDAYRAETGEYPKSLAMHCKYQWNYRRTDYGYSLTCYYFMRFYWAYDQPSNEWIEITD